MDHHSITLSPLGKKTEYSDQYDNSLLFAIERAKIRNSSNYNIQGYDIWNGYELSWLTPKGKPEIALIEIIIPCKSPFLIESKSLKLYLNSLHNSHYSSAQEVQEIIRRDLSEKTKTTVSVKLYSDVKASLYWQFPDSVLLDTLDINVDEYHPNKKILRTENVSSTEILSSNLLKSNCPVTGQPDWASIMIAYSGPKIEHSSLLKYIISYRNFQDFHEQCVENIYQDLIDQCKPEILTVYARYTRRGGLDINPIRTNDPNYHPDNSFRLLRQ